MSRLLPNGPWTGREITIVDLDGDLRSLNQLYDPSGAGIMDWVNLGLIPPTVQPVNLWLVLVVPATQAGTSVVKRVPKGLARCRLSPADGLVVDGILDGQWDGSDARLKELLHLALHPPGTWVEFEAFTDSSATWNLALGALEAGASVRSMQSGGWHKTPPTGVPENSMHHQYQVVLPVGVEKTSYLEELRRIPGVHTLYERPTA